MLGRPLRYEPLVGRRGAGRDGGGHAGAVVDAFFRFYSGGEFDDSPVVDTVRRITGRPPRAFAQWARAHATELSVSPAR